MQNLPPLIELRAFEAVARHMSFKTAASELCVTPTAVSHQIRLLERYCGCPLFRRRPRPLALTDAGVRLFPVIHGGLEAFAQAISALRKETPKRPIKVSTTNAFASRWLVPRLVDWHKTSPHASLEVIGTDSVLDLRAGEADLAIRYSRAAPPGLIARELLRDTFWPMCNPQLLPARSLKNAADLKGRTLIHAQWLPHDTEAPTWQRWLAVAQSRWSDVPGFNEMGHLSFREELHAIDAVIAGQGIGICSDVLVAQELKAGTLIKALNLELPGYGFYLVHLPDPPRQALIEAFCQWLCAAAQRTALPGAAAARAQPAARRDVAPTR